MTAETLTLTRAAALARPLGYTIRREPEAGEIVAYAKGTGKDAPAAYFTDCPIDALATVCAMAENTDSVSDSDLPAYLDALKTAREACGVPMTRAADPLGEIVAECDRMAADTPRAVDMTPTWAGLAPALFLALTNGTPEGQKIAREEMARAFAALDAHNAHAREMGEAVKAVCILLETALANSDERPARINSALDSDDLAQTIAAALDCLKAHAA